MKLSRYKFYRWNSMSRFVGRRRAFNRRVLVARDQYTPAFSSEQPQGDIEESTVRSDHQRQPRTAGEMAAPVAAGIPAIPPVQGKAEIALDAARVYAEEEAKRKRLECRFYEAQYPEIEEVVMVNVRNIAEMGAYVVLLEYNDIEGMILLSELSRRRIRSINKLIRVNRNEVAMVLRVDKEKGYIDLSKRRVSPEDVAKCEDRYNKAKAVHSVLRHVADLRGHVLEELSTKVSWPLYKKYGHAFDAFKLTLQDEEDVFVGLDIDEETKQAMITHIKRRLAPQPSKVRADIEVTCYTYEGIDAVKAALIAGKAVGDERTPIQIKLIAPPRYVMDTMTLDKDLGKSVLEKAIEVVTETIVASGGKLEVKMAPKAVSQREESELQAMLERLALENEEIDGDAPEDV